MHTFYGSISRERATRVASSDIPSTGMQRKWVIQDLSTFNRLLYLVPHESLPQYSALLPGIDEIVQTRELYNAMIQGDVSNLVHYTGPGVMVFAQLWSETQSHTPHIDWSASPEMHEGDAVITLALYGLCEPPTEWIAQFKSKTGYNQTALKLAAYPFPTERTHGDFSYIDEVESLFLAHHSDSRDLLKTRFDRGNRLCFQLLASMPDMRSEWKQSTNLQLTSSENLHNIVR